VDATAFAALTPSEGDVIFLTEDYTDAVTSAVTKGELFYEYDGTKWVEYEGAL
jgi:hypothetical protein